VSETEREAALELLKSPDLNRPGIPGGSIS